eukprot:scaffold19678_cov157-Amphora_coffeaeformis.AAC.7
MRRPGDVTGLAVCLTRQPGHSSRLLRKQLSPAKVTKHWPMIKPRDGAPMHCQALPTILFPNFRQSSSWHLCKLTTSIIIMPEQVRAAHLLIKHTGSRNPVSRRTGEQVVMSPQDAMAELTQYETKIRSEGVSDAFPKYAQMRSDCSSFKNNGDLGFFGRGQMQEPFERAAFALQVGGKSHTICWTS